MTSNDAEGIFALVANTPLFSNFTAEELRVVAKLFIKRRYRKGATICEEGEEGGSFYIVASGDLEVWGGGEKRRLLNRLTAGEVLGEMSLFYGGKRAATVTASRSAQLLELDREAFNRVFATNPKVLHYFATILSQRLAAHARDEVKRRPTIVIGVSGLPGLKGNSLVARSLAALLRQYAEAEVLLVEMQPLVARERRQRRPISLAELERASIDRVKSQLEIDATNVALLQTSVDPRNGERSHTQALNALIARVGETFPYVVLGLGERLESLAACAREVADVSVEIVDHCDPGEDPSSAEGPTRVYRVVNLFNRSSVSVPINHCEPFVLPVDDELPKTPGTAQARYILSHPRAPSSPPLRRLARKILGTTLGVAVGGGAAFAIAHLGVLKVFEDNDVPVDLVAGTSMGSVVGIGYAAGLRPDQMIDIAFRIGTKLTTLSALDFTIGRPGILSGRRLIHIFSPLFGSVKRFDQLRFPCRAVAADIESGERVSIGEGRLDTAFRASCSVPMLWVPVRHDGRVLVDGGMVNPVPVDVLHEMGADVRIGVNVVPPLKKGVTNALTRMWRRLDALNPLSYLGDNRHLPNMLDIFMNTIQMLQHELGNFKAIAADVRIVPDLSDLTWVEFYKPRDLIERGAEAAEKALPEVRRVLAERRAAAAGRSRIPS